MISDLNDECDWLRDELDKLEKDLTTALKVLAIEQSTIKESLIQWC